MKTIFTLLLVMAQALSIWADDGILPPKDLGAEWAELAEQKFSTWSIKSFLGWDMPFDGGSKVFFFESDRGERFDVMIANPSCWTELDRKNRRQVFLVVHNNRFYRIETKSEQEKNMIEKLRNAMAALSGEGKRDPKLLKSLAKRLESREPIFDFKGEWD